MGSGVLITTYSMITHTQRRSWEAEQTMKWVQEQEWGIMVLDGKLQQKKTLRDSNNRVLQRYTRFQQKCSVEC